LRSAGSRDRSSDFDGVVLEARAPAGLLGAFLGLRAGEGRDLLAATPEIVLEQSPARLLQLAGAAEQVDMRGTAARRPSRLALGHAADDAHHHDRTGSAAAWALPGDAEAREGLVCSAWCADAARVDEHDVGVSGCCPRDR
jgi:hypothetical protein